MAINGAKALDLLARIGNSNAKGEYYLTDLVEIARSLGGRVTAVDAPEVEMTGANNRAELAVIERLWQERRRHELMISGVSDDRAGNRFPLLRYVIGQDALIEPNVVFGPGAVIDGGAVIHAFSHIEGAHVSAGATVGPLRGCGRVPIWPKARRSAISAK
jgi:bifunctional UDP-N-acetylglucosamine pyrophosphorylase/glucosamine-1-phosphate N-acetyltransferase